MSEPEKILPEKQIKIYLVVLGILLILAVTITIFTAYQDQQLAQQEESEQTSEQTAQESQQTQPVQNNFMDANSAIEEESEQETEAEQSSYPAAEESSQRQDSEVAETIEPEEAVEETGALPEEEVVVASFDPESDLMLWPVSGNVLMDYSPDALIYDETLDLYRTNSSISIGAQPAEEVLAAAGGVVQEIGDSEQLGHYVVLDNGNGYLTTYGQLTQEELVEVGETVAQGEVIGHVGEPTWYSSALGTHISFTVTVNGETISPLDVLENTLDE